MGLDLKNLEYRQLALIRELVSKHRLDEVPKINPKWKYDSETAQEHMKYIEEERNPHTHLGMSNIILDRIREVEEMIQKALGM